MREVFENFLSQRGLKSTLQRNIILDTFLQIDRHVRVDDLCLILKGGHRNIGHATVYRTLKLFVESGIARELHFGDGLTRYERVTEGRQHDHLICSICNNITEFDNGAAEQLKDEVVRNHGFRIQTLKLELKGVCKQCQGEHSAAL